MSRSYQGGNDGRFLPSNVDTPEGTLASANDPHAPKDPDRVDMSDPDEIETWGRILGVSREELARAVEAAGNNALNLREHFNLRRG